MKSYRLKKIKVSKKLVQINFEFRFQLKESLTLSPPVLLSDFGVKRRMFSYRNDFDKKFFIFCESAFKQMFFSQYQLKNHIFVGNIHK